MVHTLTFSGVSVTVDGVAVTSPYTLTNSCTIVAELTADKPTPSTPPPELIVNGEQYAVDTTIDISNSDITIKGYKGDTGVVVTINYTEASTSRLSVDLTTLPGWANLSAGEKSITIVAKANGYKDSAPSAAVQVTKPSSFKQVPITVSSYNGYKVSLIENMDTTKVYTVYGGFTLDDFVYNNDKWVTGVNPSYGLYIAQQTKTSISFTMGNSYDWTGGSYVSVTDGAALEGNVQATEEDFTNIPTTKTLVCVPCFVEGTLIRMANGTDKPVENVHYGDEVKCYDFTSGLKTFAPIDWLIPESVATKYWKITFSDGSTINLVGSNGKSHRIYNLTKQRFEYPQDFEPSDVTVKDDGTIVTIVSCEEIEKTVKYYNIATKDHINVYANGFLTSNRLNNRYKIVDNKFTDEQLMSDKEIAAYKKHLENIRSK